MEDQKWGWAHTHTQIFSFKQRVGENTKLLL